MKVNLWLLIILIPVFGVSQSSVQKNLAFKAELKKTKPIAIEFFPPGAHHFNQEAPSKVEMKNGVEVIVGHLTKTLQKITSDFPEKIQMEKNCQLSVQMYLCNEKNTYCVPVKQKYQCQDLSKYEN